MPIAPAVILQYDYIQDYAYTYEEGELVVAVLLEPVYGREARYSVLREIAYTLYANYDTRVWVTCDLDLYRRIEAGDKGDLRQTILSRRNAATVP